MTVSRTLLETGPVALVPLAWGYTATVHLGWTSVRSLQIAHGVMIVLMLAFLVGGWSAMGEGALAAWRALIGVGVLVTAAGLGGFLWELSVLLGVSLYGWMIMPALALVYTGLQPSLPTGRYVGGGVCSLLGAAVYAAPLAAVDPTVLGLILVGLGQTVGIADAVRR